MPQTSFASRANASKPCGLIAGKIRNAEHAYRLMVTRSPGAATTSVAFSIMPDRTSTRGGSAPCFRVRVLGQVGPIGVLQNLPELLLTSKCGLTKKRDPPTAARRALARRQPSHLADRSRGKMPTVGAMKERENDHHGSGADRECTGKGNSDIAAARATQTIVADGPTGPQDDRRTAGDHAARI